MAHTNVHKVCITVATILVGARIILKPSKTLPYHNIAKVMLRNATLSLDNAMSSFDNALMGPCQTVQNRSNTVV